MSCRSEHRVEKDPGKYRKNRNGGQTLAALRADTVSYVIREGTEAIAPEALRGCTELRELTIPSSLHRIPDGALSNRGSWAMPSRGLTVVYVNETAREPETGNAKRHSWYISFYTEDGCFFGRKADGSITLIRYLGDAEKIVIPAFADRIAPDAFSGCLPHTVVIGRTGEEILFPYRHAYYESTLLEGFGLNGRFYDYREYDRFLLMDHMTREKLRMTCRRLDDGTDLSREKREKICSFMIRFMPKTAEFIAAANDIEGFRMLQDHGFVKEEHRDTLIDIFSRNEAGELMNLLLAGFRGNADEFDFSI